MHCYSREKLVPVIIDFGDMIWEKFYLSRFGFPIQDPLGSCILDSSYLMFPQSTIFSPLPEVVTLKSTYRTLLAWPCICLDFQCLLELT